ncbi:MAG: galactokinase [Planctomycetota bacterium]|nr:MAG: galactokinase [Planctomycetota bacterium]
MDDCGARARRCFEESFGRGPREVVRAPGRVNLIGEHTDYNDGFCLPIAIDRGMYIAWDVSAHDAVRVYNADPSLPSTSIPLRQPLHKEPETPWYSYIQGCIQVLQDAGVELRGCDLALCGDVPMGSGLSSSAALEVATIFALLRACEHPLSLQEVAVLAQRAENTFVGVQCGILDQLSSACCRAGHAMLMDCRSLELQHVPMGDDVAVVIADTGKRRGLVDSAYNERRSQCEMGARALAVSHLRDVTMQGLMMAHDQGALDTLAKQRCEHVVAENGRTRAAAACMRAGDSDALGLLMDQSHADLRDKFAVTCPELDHMVAVARSLPGCLGARMTGAGFGGCTVSLVQRDAAEDFVPALLAGYAQYSPLPAAVYVSAAAPGVGVVA